MNAADLVRKTRPFAWVASATALVAIITWQVSDWSPSPQTRAAQSAFGNSADPGVDIYPPADRTSAPELVGTTLDGGSLALSEYAGNIVIVNVWGSWCGPCRAETPDLVRLAHETDNQGVQFVGVDTRDNLSAQVFEDKFDLPYPSLFDEGGQTLLPFRDVIPIAVIPSTVVLDRQGRVAARVIGPVTYNTLNGLLDAEIARGRR